MDLARLLAQLESLRDGPASVAGLIAHGAQPIPALRSFLLEGRITSLPEPRRWAVEALAGLGAKDVLMEYLEQERNIGDPVLQFAEWSVQNAAARALAAWLEDDACRRSADDALRALGPAAVPLLFAAALRPSDDPSGESPSGVRRRRSVAWLVAEASLSGEEWTMARALLMESDAEITVAACRMAIASGDAVDQTIAVERLLEVLPEANAFLQIEIEDCLVTLHAEARSRLNEEIRRRTALPTEHQATDQTLRTRIRVRRRVGASPRRAERG
jgi:hypothetical protein